MDSPLIRVLLVFGMVFTVSCFGSSDDRFIKKYAMMKIYESCFGPDVVKEIRREMKAACAKCAEMAAERNTPPPPGPPIYNGRLPPIAINNPNGFKEGQGIHQSNEILLGQIPSQLPTQNHMSPIDTDKLQQVIMNYQQQQQQQQPFAPYGPQNLDIRFGNAPVYPIISPYFQQFSPPQFNPLQYPYFQQPFPFYSQRISRDMDFRNRLEVLTSRSSGKVRNVTCVMQELGYLDQNLEPNYEKIAERIDNLPVASELKSDIQDGLLFCQKFASCVPESKSESSPLSRELIKPMFFFRCYKHKKLEACVMKDIRDRFSNEEDIDTDTEIRSMSRVGKSFKTTAASSQAYVDELDDIAVSVYDFLYGGADMDLESVL